MNPDQATAHRELERRSNVGAVPTLEDRGGDQLPLIRGRVLTFGALSEPMHVLRKDGTLRRFRETIVAGALDRTLRERPDIKALGDHLPYRILGRTAAGTLRLDLTAEGLDAVIEPPPNSIGRDAVVSIRRGDIDGMSFGFFPVASEWSEADDGSGELRHTVAELDLREVTITAFPAFGDGATSLSVRSEAALEDFLTRSAAAAPPQATAGEVLAEPPDHDQADAVPIRAAARRREIEVLAIAIP
jgi:uncharacterized protein